MNALPKKILITGAAGRVASRLSPLLSGHHELFLTDVRAQPSLDISALDILDQKAVTEAARGMDAILHCAIASYDTASSSENGRPESLRRYHDSVLEVNIKGTYNIYEAARLAKVPCIIYISSLTVVLGRESASLDPGMPPCPSNLYAVSKLFGEHLGELYARKHGIRTVALRLGQPIPLGLPQEADWLQDEEHHYLLVDHHVIAEAALTSLASDAGGLFMVSHVTGGVPPPASRR